MSPEADEKAWRVLEKCGSRSGSYRDSPMTTHQILLQKLALTGTFMFKAKDGKRIHSTCYFKVSVGRTDKIVVDILHFCRMSASKTCHSFLSFVALH